MPQETGLSTGLPALDQVLKGILAGDNIVWQVDAIEEYAALVRPYAAAAVRQGRRLVYFRFARHPALLREGEGIAVHTLDPTAGFETFIADIHAVIHQAGLGAFYVFDCLSRLAVDWYSDQMLGNFFMLTCPYLYDLETVTYFALYRNYHTQHALRPIRDTTQLFLDLYRHKGTIYVRPVKVQQRYSPTMNMLHAWRGEAFLPVSASPVIAEILTSAKWSGLSSDSSVGFWENAFTQARELLKSGEYRPDLPEKGKSQFEQLVRLIISRDDGMQRLIGQYLSLQDVLDIRKRMIGTGLIGGKAVGMLVARAILRQAAPRLGALLEEHDSFFIGSDVFYTYLVTNGVWWVRQTQRDPARFLEGAELARRRILTGTFPAHIVEQMEEMLDYFGQSPFIVRSSSLLEDNYGNSFAGKYDSVFCANQGPRERRLQDFLAAVRTIYASSMSERALQYRAQRDMLDRDEQMALLVMRVSGAASGHRFYPHAAGVGFSFNPYAWDPAIAPEAGVVRLVFGLGTRAVDRADDDYTRIVALNAPEKRPEHNFETVAQYAQRRVDVLDLEANQLVSTAFDDLLAEAAPQALSWCASPARVRGEPAPRILTFDGLLRETDFVGDLREALAQLETAYNYPVDIEFTLNAVEEGGYKLNLLQCRPLQVQGTGALELPAVTAPVERRVIEAHGAVIGQSRYETIGRIVYVAPEAYGQLAVQERHGVARLLGRLNRVWPRDDAVRIMLLGPGRWGTSSPSLGIPVQFAEISRVHVLVELVTMHETLVPDVSLGTHFLNELVEMNLLYLALAPREERNRFQSDFFMEQPNTLTDWLPDAGAYESLVRVLDCRPEVLGAPLRLNADARQQRVVCFRE
ncbi:MAG: PEP/pyruvate-binding domain-containing protein [Candidatus Marinimicrobia bacterium]|nr:PEP/pyruvate-binding domain-containing protein [Candidatus Neomarinimicrobiota bacterium]